MFSRYNEIQLSPVVIPLQFQKFKIQSEVGDKYKTRFGNQVVEILKTDMSQYLYQDLALKNFQKPKRIRDNRRKRKDPDMQGLVLENFQKPKPKRIREKKLEKEQIHEQLVQ